MREVFILKISSLVFFLLSTVTLVTALSTNQWIVNMPSIYGPVTESLWTTCDPSGCTAVRREARFMYSISVILILTAVYGAFFTADLLRVTFFQKTSGIKLSHTHILPAISILVSMSIYTWHITRDVEQKYRGWSFYFGWVSSPLFLIAAAVTIFFRIFWEIELENTITSMEFHARAIDT